MFGYLRVLVGSFEVEGESVRFSFMTFHIVL